MYRTLFILFSSLICLNYVSSTDYCNRDLCKQDLGTSVRYLTHIGCRHNGRNAPQCPRDAKILPMSTKRKNLILRMHNRLRNRIALGQIPGYPKAIRMPVLRWDDELAYLAELNVKQCQMKHDECRNTAKFKNAGQNLAYARGTPLHNALQIKTSIRGWFNEYKNGNVTFIDKYSNGAKGVIGHFTAMVQDRTDTVGCAILRHSNNRYFFFACNYSFTNFYGQKVYSKGDKSCSRCRTGCSKIYKGLCKAHEYVEADPYETLD